MPDAETLRDAALQLGSLVQFNTGLYHMGRMQTTWDRTRMRLSRANASAGMVTVGR